MTCGVCVNARGFFVLHALLKSHLYFRLKMICQNLKRRCHQVGSHALDIAHGLCHGALHVVLELGFLVLSYGLGKREGLGQITIGVDSLLIEN